MEEKYVSQPHKEQKTCLRKKKVNIVLYHKRKNRKKRRKERKFSLSYKVLHRIHTIIKRKDMLVKIGKYI